MSAILDALAALWALIRRGSTEKAAREVAQGKKVQASVDADLATINGELTEPPKPNPIVPVPPIPGGR